MHPGPDPHQTPPQAAARPLQGAAREARSPLQEEAAVWAMIGSAVTTAAPALLQTVPMLRGD